MDGKSCLIMIFDRIDNKSYRQRWFLFFVIPQRTKSVDVS
jgi:hypothetical protein